MIANVFFFLKGFFLKRSIVKGLLQKGTFGYGHEVQDKMDNERV